MKAHSRTKLLAENLPREDHSEEICDREQSERVGRQANDTSNSIGEGQEQSSAHRALDIGIMSRKNVKEDEDGCNNTSEMEPKEVESGESQT